jgi:hypothetical protein
MGSLRESGTKRPAAPQDTVRIRMFAGIQTCRHLRLKLATSQSALGIKGAPDQKDFKVVQFAADMERTLIDGLEMFLTALPRSHGGDSLVNK